MVGQYNYKRKQELFGFQTLGLLSTNSAFICRYLLTDITLWENWYFNPVLKTQTSGITWIQYDIWTSLNKPPHLLISGPSKTAGSRPGERRGPRLAHVPARGEAHGWLTSRREERPTAGSRHGERRGPAAVHALCFVCFVFCTVNWSCILSAPEIIQPSKRPAF